tara:strand:- start:1035 stop:1592 length:558 start_codon:yes stop_codon:yes gene_type:complete
MRFIYFLLIIFISLTNEIKADSKKQTLDELKKGGNIIFIRHAYAPGGGDPNNFDINDCSTQRNLNKAGQEQSKKIGIFFKKNDIPIDLVISSEWCRCQETALIAFTNFETKKFLNSFYSEKFAKNKKTQMKNLKRYINNWKSNNNLVLVTHYVVINEALNYSPVSGEIVISDKNLIRKGNIQIEY